MTRTAFITGATSGIGRECTVRFVRAGWRVVEVRAVVDTNVTAFVGLTRLLQPTRIARTARSSTSAPR
ncbi:MULTISPECIES: hypothetical protein [unclassified Streptomyces]|uniref:hypothetical protein n=1 Tax=unclassified Streptomyces TaxID=2593676 RepID=UPI003D91C697